jgi:dTDP-glucose 4,6-dehydratase
LRLLVTGGAGFIGSNFVRMVLGERPILPGVEKLTVLDALTYSGSLSNLSSVSDEERYEFVRGDINNRELVDRLVQESTCIVHFAAESHVDRSIDSGRKFIETNVLGTQTLLDSARNHSGIKFLHVSTDEVYGSINTGSWTEEHPIEPNSPYAASKAGSDMLVRAYNKTFGLNTVITRCSNNYGPYQYPEKVIPLFVTNLIYNKRLPLYGSGKNVRDWLHVDDHCRGIALAIERGRSGEIYNLGGGTELTNIELTQTILGIMGKSWDFVDHVDDRLGHDLRYNVDISKATNELGYKPLVKFSDGIEDTVSWYQKNQAWWQALTNLEIKL